MFKPYLTTCVALALLPCGAFAASLPYIEDFDDGTDVFVKTTPAAGSWQYTGTGDLALSYAVSLGGTNSSSATAEFPALGGSSNLGFTMQTDFTVGGDDPSISNFLFAGFMVLGNVNNPDFFGYLPEVRFDTGEVRIREIRDGAGVNAIASQTFGALQFGQTYTATLVGEYGTDGPGGSDSLALTYTISGGNLAMPLQVSGVDDDGTLQTGSHFGLRNRFSNLDVSIDYDDFSLTAVPEPASAGLLMLGLAAFTRRRRA
ncbi:MAG: PEP-CTERM sorting domain-containing protein [Phycisphaerae bacterium]